jgi:hypothetical protein
MRNTKTQGARPVNGSPHPLALLLTVVAISLVGCTQLSDFAMGRSTDVAWDNDPATTIIKLYSPHTTAGLSGAYDSRYYIPEVQVWGDGRIIWVEREGRSRRVLEGHLTEAETEALLTSIVEAGFFDWEESYQTLGGNSSAWMHLLVNLSDRSKEIREHGGAPDAYYDVEARLLGGAGADGREFVPACGYLTARPFSAGGGGPQWPAGADITPDDIGDGRYVEGRLLRFVWDLVNQDPPNPIYASYGGHTFTIMVQIPDVSLTQPPRPSECATR